MSQAQKKRYEDPKQREQLGQRGYYKDPEWRAKNRARVTEELKDPERRAVHSQKMKDWWSDPVNREKRLTQYRRHWDDPEYWKRMGERDYYKDPEWRAKQRINGFKSVHTRWHVGKNRINPDCPFCQPLQ
jgi:hypothetical protein